MKILKFRTALPHGRIYLIEVIDGDIAVQRF